MEGPVRVGKVVAPDPVISWLEVHVVVLGSVDSVRSRGSSFDATLRVNCGCFRVGQGGCRRKHRVDCWFRCHRQRVAPHLRDKGDNNAGGSLGRITT